MLNMSYLCKTIYTNCSHRKGDVSTKPQAHTQYQIFQSTKPLDFSETLTGLNIPILHTAGNYSKNMSAGQVCEPQSKRPTVELSPDSRKDNCTKRRPAGFQGHWRRGCSGLVQDWTLFHQRNCMGCSGGEGQEGGQRIQAGTGYCGCHSRYCKVKSTHLGVFLKAHSTVIRNP